jgi:DNA-binding NtrC family response regulator
MFPAQPGFCGGNPVEQAKKLERRIVVVGDALQSQALQRSEGAHEGSWRLVEAASHEAADTLLANAPDIRVGVWSHRAEPATTEEHEKLSALRSRHARVQWLALLPAQVAIDERLASFIANDFFDYLTAPVSAERLYACAGHAYGMSLVVECAQGKGAHEEEQMVGTSELMRRLFADIRKVAPSSAPVLITGESGTGKELSARAIHERSSRAKGPFVAVDCGSIPQTLIQSELFGFEKGAFTGAGQRRAGRIESAHGGTLFLDEVGDLPLDMQGNLLRFLQESTIQRLGSSRPLEVDARVIAATHVDLEDAVKQGRFREDLYYRLNVLRLNVPALRQREGDIEVLARYFLGQFLKESKKKVVGFTTRALEAMRKHSWPGNIRELINRVRRAIVMCDGNWIGPRDLDLEQVAAVQETFVLHLTKAREAVERKVLAEALKVSDQNYSAAARMLGVSRVTLYRLLEKHQLLSGSPGR